MLLTVTAFLVAIAVLVFIHEYGHYRAALFCSVKVERFAIGFGRPILAWKKPGSTTEFVIGMLPLGGYVKMVDEREGPVAQEDLPYAFNRKSLAARALIVAAGPLANLLVAALLYAMVGWAGQTDAKAVVASPVAGSQAQIGGLVAGDQVLRVGNRLDQLKPVNGYGDFSWQVTQLAFDEDPLLIEVLPQGRTTPKILEIRPKASIATEQQNPLTALGFRGVFSAPVLSQISTDSAAHEAGLLDGDRVIQVNGQEIVDAAMLRDLIRSNHGDPPLTQSWRVSRGEQQMTLDVTPRRVWVDQQPVGRIGAAVGAEIERVSVRYGFFDGLAHGVQRTYEMAQFSLVTLFKMVLGEVSIQHLSGPVSIAEYAGKTAERGLQSYLLFLAVISVSLGVLNLLPIPVLDGGHLMYYLWEGLTGKAVSDQWLKVLQHVGVASVMLLMGIGLFNDFSRIFSSLGG